MNFDRTHQASKVPNKKANLSLAGKIQKLPIISRIYLYVFLMATIGMAIGEGKYQLETAKCITKSDCWAIEPAQRRVKELGLGATAGAIAATLISIPALLEEK